MSLTYWAAESRNRQVIAELVSAGCPFCGTELHYPVYKRDLEIVKCLLGYGCDPNVPFGRDGPDGPQKWDTPLIVAVRKSLIERSRYDKGVKERMEVTQLLLAAGAIPNVANAKGRSPLLLAVQQNEVELAKLLLEAGADPDFAPRKEEPDWLSPSAMANERKMYAFMRLFTARRKS